jgi:NADP-dependent 3-hydroxy acid dehydrogenase YdfG
VLSARRADKIESLAEEIRSRGRVALVRPLDVTDKAASERIGRELAGAGGIHVLVNNAGVMPLSPVLEDRVDEWEQTIDVNIKGVCVLNNADPWSKAAKTRNATFKIINADSI